jgi:hypothetical protein
MTSADAGHARPLRSATPRPSAKPSTGFAHAPIMGRHFSSKVGLVVGRFRLVRDRVR